MVTTGGSSAPPICLWAKLVPDALFDEPSGYATFGDGYGDGFFGDCSLEHYPAASGSGRGTGDDDGNGNGHAGNGMECGDGTGDSVCGHDGDGYS